MAAPRRTMAGGAKKRPTRYEGEGPGHTPADLARALRAHKKGDHAVAVEGYRAVISSAPDALDAWMNLAAACITLGRAREARAAFARALDLARTNARAQRDAGIGLAALGIFDGARAALESALALDPTLGGARLALSRVCAQAGDRDAAVFHAECAVRDQPGDASSWLELHRALFDDRAMAPCIDAARRAVALDPGYALARYLLAGALGWDGDATAAARALGDDGVVDPGLRDALGYVQAHRTRALRSFAVAREALHFALENAPRNGNVLEFGVRHGVSTRAIAERTRDEVHAFDSFAGLPTAWKQLPPGVFSTAGEVPELPEHVRVHVGWFADTLPAFVATMRDAPRLIHVDSDLYESARTVLDALGPRIEPGCVIVFDEYLGGGGWRDDEFRAFAEAVATFDWRYEYLALCWITGQAVLRVL